ILTLLLTLSPAFCDNTQLAEYYFSHASQYLGKSVTVSVTHVTPTAQIPVSLPVRFECYLAFTAANQKTGGALIVCVKTAIQKSFRGKYGEEVKFMPNGADMKTQPLTGIFLKSSVGEYYLDCTK
ncbi:MAG: hypothetical protein ABI443_05330, partial [Chthoniobacterales bacterium]